jgi:hypothetical protein
MKKTLVAVLIVLAVVIAGVVLYWPKGVDPVDPLGVLAVLRSHLRALRIVLVGFLTAGCVITFVWSVVRFCKRQHAASPNVVK